MSTYSFLLAGIVLGGLLGILCLVFTIISLVKARMTPSIVWGIGFLVCVTVAAISVVKAAQQAVSDVAKNSNLQDIMNGEIDKQNVKSKYFVEERQRFLDSLKANTNDRYDGEVPKSFYANEKASIDGSGTLDLPFVYPFKMRYNPTTFTGDIFMDGNDSVFVKNVSAMTFDQNFALIKIDNSLSAKELKDGHAETEYVLFDLRTRNFEPAADLDKLNDLARRIGYNGSYTMQSISYDYIGWTSDTGRFEE